MIATFFANVLHSLLSLIVGDVTAWIKEKEAVAAAQAANKKAVQDGIANQNSTEIENQLGNPNAGDPSGLPGVEHRAVLPGVSQSKPS